MKSLPYALRYLIAIVAWAGVIGGDLFARFAIVYLIPFMCLRPPSQEKAQMFANLADFMTRPLLRFPRADWRLLLGRRRPAEGRAKLIQ